MPAWSEVVQIMSAALAVLVCVVGYAMLFVQVRQSERSIPIDPSTWLYSQVQGVLHTLLVYPERWLSVYAYRWLRSADNLVLHSRLPALAEQISDFLHVTAASLADPPATRFLLQHVLEDAAEQPAR